MGFSFLHRLTAPKFQRYVHRDQSLKMVFVINHELKMGKEKSLLRLDTLLSKQRSTRVKCVLNFSCWLSTGQKKICVKADDARHIEQIEQQAKQHNVLSSKTHDAGHTQIPAGSLTVLALGPDEDEKLDALTGELKLL